MRRIAAAVVALLAGGLLAVAPAAADEPSVTITGPGNRSVEVVGMLPDGSIVARVQNPNTNLGADRYLGMVWSPDGDVVTGYLAPRRILTRAGAFGSMPPESRVDQRYLPGESVHYRGVVAYTSRYDHLVHFLACR